MAWAFANWMQAGPTGSPARLAALRSHIAEVTTSIQTGDYTIEGRSVSKGTIQKTLDKLYELEEREATRVDQASGARLRFTQGRPLG